MFTSEKYFASEILPWESWILCQQMGCLHFLDACPRWVWYLLSVWKVYLFWFFLPEKKFCILPVYERFTCLRCFSSRELATLQVFEMFSCLRCLPEIERAGHFASVWDVYLRKSWALCPCIRCLSVWDVFTKRGRERVGHFASDWDGYLFEIMQAQEICVLCKCLRC